MKKIFEKEIWNYTLYGAFFGVLFPVGATIIECFHTYGSLTLSHIQQAQSENALLWIIDSAPFWLGLFACFGGRRQDDLLEQNRLIEIKVAKRTEELQLAKEESEKANQAKTEFLSRMSHELKTPLNAILGFTQLFKLDSEKFNGKENANLDRILKSGKHLLALIDDVLEVTDIEEGRILLKPANVCLETALIEVVEMSQAQADKRKIQLKRISNNKVVAFVDEVRLREILLNLVSNAIQYNKEGGRVGITVLDLERKSRVRVEVEDTGTGISEEHQKIIFEPFGSLGIKTSNSKGVGIGLAITLRLTELMKGTLEVRSQLGKGSCFSVEFPRGQQKHF